MARPKDPELRRRLIVAGSKEFAAKGFAATTLGEIGAAAGVTKGGIYFHFRSKEELFFAVVDHWRGAHRALVAPAPGEPQSLRGFLVDYLGFHFQHPEASSLLRVLASEMRGHFTTRVREDHQATMRAVRGRIRDLLGQGLHDGSLFTTDPAMATFVLAAAVEGVLSLVGSSPRDAEPFRHPDSLVDFLLAPYETAGGGDEEGTPRTSEAEGVDFLPPL